MKFFRILALSAVIYANIGAMESDINPLDSEQQELASRIKQLPPEMSYLVAQSYFDKLLKRTDFKSEQDLIDSLNAFNAANKITNLVVKDYLKTKAKTDPKYTQLIVAGNDTKTFAKQFTKLKLDLIDGIITKKVEEKVGLHGFQPTQYARLKDMISHLIATLDFVKKFQATNWLKNKIKNVTGWMQAKLMSAKYLTSDHLELFLEAGMDPNITINQKPLLATYINYYIKAQKPEEKEQYFNDIQILIKYGANKDQYSDDLAELFKDRKEELFRKTK
jgi:hypothetical protein